MGEIIYEIFMIQSDFALEVWVSINKGNEAYNKHDKHRRKLFCSYTHTPSTPGVYYIINRLFLVMV